MNPERSRSLPVWAIGPFVKHQGVNPIIKPDPSLTFHCPMQNRPIQWEALHVFNPAAIVYENKVHLIYRAEDNSGPMNIGGHCSRLGMATSFDGFNFEKRPHPILFPDNDSQKEFEWRGGCEDPRITCSETGEFILTYTQHDWETPPNGWYSFHLGIATSTDLLTWKKHGPLFLKQGLDFAIRRKAGAIVSRLDGDRMIAVRINGKYWMYWGEGNVFLAYSDDLLNWIPVFNHDGSLLTLLAPRQGMFDSGFPEVGSTALLTCNGIVLFYNGVNSNKNHLCDTSVPMGAYCGGQALFDAEDPSILLDRLDNPFIEPTEEFEKTGQYGPGTTFIEGLVRLQSKWFLYYGCADSFIGVAVAG